MALLRVVTIEIESGEHTLVNSHTVCDDRHFENRFSNATNLLYFCIA